MEPPKDKKPSLADQILHWGELGYDPELSEKDRAVNQTKFVELIEK
jgi:hypothetical protein